MKRGAMRLGQMIDDLIGHCFMKTAAIAKRPEIELERLEFDAQPIGHVLQFQRGEIRLAGLWAQTGEFRDVMRMV